MPVFKAYVKIIRKNAGQLLMYIGIVLALAIMMNQFNAQKPQAGFTNTKIQLAFFNEDSGAKTGIADGLKEYLQKYANFVEIANDPDKIRDALFFGEISYVIQIPAGFADNFARDGQLRLRQQSAPDSTTSAYMAMLVNKYLNTARLYRQGLPDASAGEIVSLTLANLKQETTVDMAATESWAGSYANVVYFYNYLAYALLAMLILGITTCMMTFNVLDLKRRNLCSPLTLRSLNLQMIAGGLLFSFFSWGCLVAVSFTIYGRTLLTQAGYFLILNSFVYMLVGLALSYLVGNLLKSRNAQAAVSNVLTLGMSFISGVFVPQVILGKTVLSIARFTPTYWFVKANIAIGAQSDFSGPGMQNIITAMLVQLIFMAGFLAVASVIMLRKRQAAN
jgi:ABC-2 type transport system permease protein